MYFLSMEIIMFGGFFCVDLYIYIVVFMLMYNYSADDYVYASLEIQAILAVQLYVYSAI